MKLDESFFLMISFLIFCLFVGKPLFINIRNFLQKKVLEIKDSILSVEKSRDDAFKDLKKLKKAFLVAQKDADEHIASFASIVEESLRKENIDLILSMEKKRLDNLKLLNIQKDQKILSLYNNFITESSYIAEGYLLNNRSQIPSDIQIARDLIKNI